MTIAEATTPISPWNSLEWAKLLVAVLTPISVIVFGFWLNRRLKRFEHLQWASQKVIEKRLRVFEELAPLLNDILCYFTYIGCWKEFSPPDMVNLKRQADRIAYVNAPLFPADFLTHYNKFIGLCYGTYSGWGQDAKLRTQYRRRAEASSEKWLEEWAACFADENQCMDAKALRDAYGEFVAYFAKELGIGVRAEPVATGRPPANIQ